MRTPFWRAAGDGNSSGRTVVTSVGGTPLGNSFIRLVAPRVLVVPPFSEYSVFYHRLTIDRKGRLFLSYDYWSTFWFYRNDHFGRRRALLMSPDGGDTWKMAETKDLR